MAGIELSQADIGLHDGRQRVQVLRLSEFVYRVIKSTDIRQEVAVANKGIGIVRIETDRFLQTFLRPRPIMICQELYQSARCIRIRQARVKLQRVVNSPLCDRDRVACLSKPKIEKQHICIAESGIGLREIWIESNCLLVKINTLAESIRCVLCLIKTAA